MLINRDFSQWTMQRVDTQERVLRIGHRETVGITELKASHVLGIRHGGEIDILRSDVLPTVRQIELARKILQLDTDPHLSVLPTLDTGEAEPGPVGHFHVKLLGLPPRVLLPAHMNATAVICLNNNNK